MKNELEHLQHIQEVIAGHCKEVQEALSAFESFSEEYYLNLPGQWQRHAICKALKGASESSTAAANLFYEAECELRPYLEDLEEAVNPPFSALEAVSWVT
ncbi:MAG: hypothetical protein ABJ056_01125 [Halioglobus sp.]